MFLIYFLLGIGMVIGALMLWVKISIWIMGLGVDDDNKICWPWRE